MVGNLQGCIVSNVLPGHLLPNVRVESKLDLSKYKFKKRFYNWLENNADLIYKAMDSDDKLNMYKTFLQSFDFDFNNIYDCMFFNNTKFRCYIENPKSKALNLPTTVRIEPTNHCNCNCITCAREKNTRPLGYMKFSDLKIIIDKFSKVENWYPFIFLYDKGEPLLHKDIFSMINYVGSRGYVVGLSTNCTLLDDDKIDSLLSCGLDSINVTFDTLDRDDFKIMRKGMDYDLVKSNIIKLVERNESVGHPLDICVSCVKNSLYTKDIDETRRFWESYPVDNFHVKFLGSFVTNSNLYSDSIEMFKDNPRSLCLIPFHHMHVSWNGNVNLCSGDFNDVYVTGNLLKDSVSEVWNGVKAQDLRSALIVDDFSFFKKCGLRCDLCNLPYVPDCTPRGLGIDFSF